MESPFYGNYWSQPARPHYSSNASNVHGIHHKPLRTKQYSPKVVQIPVHFVNSDPDSSNSTLKIQRAEPNRSASALKIQKSKPDRSILKIQKVFRGFVVRKSVRKIVSIKKEVDEIEQKLLRSETTKLMQSNENERLRVNETLMSLLFKLDSIRGVDSGVRDLRKAVIKKAIYLQEKVDAIVFAANEIEVPNDSNIPVDATLDITKSTEDQVECGETTDNQSASNCTTNYDETRAAEEHILVPEIDKCEDMHGIGIDTDVKEEWVKKPELGDDGKRNTELLLEKMMEENEKVMSLMTQMCQRSEMQTRVLSSLTQRVEQLEKAFVCDKSRRKNKKKRHSN